MRDVARLSLLKGFAASRLGLLRANETGAALVEYALLLLLVLVVAIVALVFLGSTSPVPINNVAGHLSNSA